MKHLYVLLAAILVCIATTNAQTRYWVGPAIGGAWNNTNNWANTSNGTAGQSVPNASTFNVIFDKTAAVTVDVSTFSLNTLTITGPFTVGLSATTSGVTLDLVSASTAAPAIKIDAASTLEIKGVASGGNFIVNLPASAYGLVQGIWSFSGVIGGIGYVSFPAATGQGTLLDVDGTIRVTNDQGFVSNTVPQYLNFKAGSQYVSSRNGGLAPAATWAATSTLSITGSTTGVPTIQLPPPGQGIGNLTINCPALINDVYLNLTNGLKISGNFEVISSNNFKVFLGQSVAQPATYIFEKDFTINSNSAVVVAPNVNYSYTLQVNGNFVQNGGSFNFLTAAGTATLPVTLGVAGNITQLAGATFGSTNTTTSTATELFVLEVNGTTNQNISFASGTIDNTNNQVTLRLNNTAGATLTAPLAVGKLSWNSTNKGNLATSTTNLLTINNSSSTDALVVNGPSNTGYVNGPLVRNTAANVYYTFPTGKGGVLRACDVKPSAASTSVYSAEYFGSAYSDLSVVAPLTAVSDQEYWNISKVSGNDANIRLTLASALTGASAVDAVLVAHYNGTDWVKVNGTKITPGNAATGSVESSLQTSFSPFTLAYLPLATLPIYLLDFTARKDGTTTKLNWTITDNSNPDRFEILRSLNGSDFSLLGSVRGATQKWDYAFTDNNLPAGTTYYRLRMIDVNQSVQYSKIATVVNGNKDVIITAVVPTVVSNTARLDVSAGISGTMQLVVTDINGRIVLQQVNKLTNGNQQIIINKVGGLSKGTYHVTGYLSNGTRTAAIRFVKQ